MSQFVDPHWGDERWIARDARAIRRPFVGKTFLFLEPKSRNRQGIKVGKEIQDFFVTIPLSSCSSAAPRTPFSLNRIPGPIEATAASAFESAKQCIELTSAPGHGLPARHGRFDSQHCPNFNIIERFPLERGFHHGGRSRRGIQDACKNRAAWSGV